MPPAFGCPSQTRRAAARSRRLPEWGRGARQVLLPAKAGKQEVLCEVRQRSWSAWRWRGGAPTPEQDEECASAGIAPSVAPRTGQAIAAYADPSPASISMVSSASGVHRAKTPALKREIEHRVLLSSLFASPAHSASPQTDEFNWGLLACFMLDDGWTSSLPELL